MKRYLLAGLVLIQVISFSAQASAKASLPGKKGAVASRKVAQVLDWASLKHELLMMEARFKAKNVSEEQKVDMLPRSNEVLSNLQDVKYTEAEKMDQIQTVVRFLGASIEYDFANSNTNTIYFDYKTFKKAYVAEINKLERTQRAQVKEAFADWEQYEKDGGADNEEGADE